MQKIKISSMVKIALPVSCQNVDISYGFSYFCGISAEVKTITENSWDSLILDKLNNRQYAVAGFENQEIVNEIGENANFIAQRQPETTQGLHVQINAKSGIGNDLAQNMIQNKNHLKEAIEKDIDENKSYIYRHSKNMFLGIDCFKKDNSFYNSMSEKISHNDIVALVFFHEYSHMAELVYEDKFDKNLKNNAYDNLNKNFKNYEVMGRVEKLIIEEKLKENINKNNSMYEIPDRQIIKTLQTLHLEIYADVSALLLLRNKKIEKCEYENSNFEIIINHMGETRRKEKENMLFLTRTKQFGVYLNTHYTTPGLESLDKLLKEFAYTTQDKQLTDSQIHAISKQCVDIGVSKTLLALIEGDESLSRQLNTISSLELNSEVITLNKNKNHFQEVLTQLIKNVPEIWYQNFNKKLKIIKESVDSGKIIGSTKKLIFNAALEEKSFEQNLESEIKRSQSIKSVTNSLFFDFQNSDKVESNISKIRKSLNKNDKRKNDTKIS